MNADALNVEFGIPGKVKFNGGKGGFIFVEITRPEARAVVSTYGAHVLSFEPRGQYDVLWMSEKSVFEKGKPIRGGIPVCFPWFGPHESDPKKPLHGFARIIQWNVLATRVHSNGEIELKLGITDTEETRELWPFHFKAEMTIKVGRYLDVTLESTNTGHETFSYTDALHSYFSVSDVTQIGLKGLGGRNYYDGLENGAVRRQDTTTLVVRNEENRRYFDFDGPCTIDDPGYSRKILVERRGSLVMLVWNPWLETSRGISDMHSDGYRTMICVEAVNAHDDKVVLSPGKTFSLSTRLSLS
ncbi:MAG: D-hexose-6-phosphate mutarotase [Bacteroidetes bacterium]|nr:D-hexose-6-phosphate mutarotase [Bacteroidota bacterium]